MQDKNILERLVEISPGMEIWWDSSPLIYDSWCRAMLAKAKPEDVPIMKTQFDRMYNRTHPESSLFRGVTTNPSLSLQAIRGDEKAWKDIVDDLIRENPGADRRLCSG